MKSEGWDLILLLTCCNHANTLAFFHAAVQELQLVQRHLGKTAILTDRVDHLVPQLVDILRILKQVVHQCRGGHACRVVRRERKQHLAQHHVVFTIPGDVEKPAQCIFRLWRRFAGEERFLALTTADCFFRLDETTPLCQLCPDGAHFRKEMVNKRSQKRWP